MKVNKHLTAVAPGQFWQSKKIQNLKLIPKLSPRFLDFCTGLDMKFVKSIRNNRRPDVELFRPKSNKTRLNGVLDINHEIKWSRP